MKNKSEKREMSYFMDSAYCKSTVYAKKENNEYIFCDIRTMVDIKKIKMADEQDFSDPSKSAIERLYLYNQVELKGFEIDYCKSSRIDYLFKPMRDLYFVLWGIDTENSEKTIVDSSETIVSPKQNIVRVFPELKKKQRGRSVVDWEKLIKIDKEKYSCIEEFSYNVATIGNYMPVPSCEQRILNFFCERFDMLLICIKEYFVKDKSSKKFSDEMKKWLDQYKGMKAEENWKQFVDSNYLKGSFVDGNYEVVSYNGTLIQLSQFIHYRSIVMIEEYEKRLKELYRSY